MTKLQISFEFFPPKTAEGMAKLENTAKKLMTLNPDFFSVTYGAGGSTRHGTINTVQMLMDKLRTQVAPHLACVGSTREEIIELLQIYKEIGAKRIVALRGDLPSGMGQSGELKFASELISLIRQETNDYFHIDVAAYPEFHPQAKSAVDDILNLKDKMDAGADSAITQYFFNPDAYFYFLDKCEKFHVNKPIVPGIMPITQFGKLLRFSDSCGAEIPRWMRKRFESYHDDHEAIQALGVEIIHDLCEQLIKGGAPGLHFYTLNQSDVSVVILQKLDSLVKTHIR